MRLPQDRILHIDTELKKGKLNITAEWQGELVLCKDCIYSEEFAKDNPHLVTCEHGLIGGYGEVWEDTNYCSFGERKDENCKPEIVPCEDCIYAEETWTEYHEDYIECTQYDEIERRGGYCLFGKREGGDDE